LGANLFGEGEESKVDEEERELQLEKLKRKVMGKKTMKDLMKLEHAMDYDDSDSDKDGENPFTDSSVSRLASYAQTVFALTLYRIQILRKRRRTRSRRKMTRRRQMVKRQAARAQLPRVPIRHPESTRL
jgi:hypothetical protein